MSRCWVARIAFSTTTGCDAMKFEVREGCADSRRSQKSLNLCFDSSRNPDRCLICLREPICPSETLYDSGILENLSTCHRFHLSRRNSCLNSRSLDVFPTTSRHHTIVLSRAFVYPRCPAHCLSGPLCSVLTSPRFSSRRELLERRARPLAPNNPKPFCRTNH